MIKPATTAAIALGVVGFAATQVGSHLIGGDTSAPATPTTPASPTTAPASKKNCNPGLSLVPQALSQHQNLVNRYIGSIGFGGAALLGVGALLAVHSHRGAIAQGLAGAAAGLGIGASVAYKSVPLPFQTDPTKPVV
jgi:hypothetical protein